MNCKVVYVSLKFVSGEMENLEKYVNFCCLLGYKYFMIKEENSGWYRWNGYVLKYNSRKINIIVEYMVIGL